MFFTSSKLTFGFYAVADRKDTITETYRDLYRVRVKNTCLSREMLNSMKSYRL